MSPDYLHNHPQFFDLIRIVGREKSINPILVEKDYWIMHCLYGLQRLGMTFELKGGTSLSKGFQIIDRFSEDIDLRIEPPAGRDVKTGRNQTKPAQVQSRRDFYDWLAETIRIDGIVEVVRDRDFDNDTLLSGGIRLLYKSMDKPLEGLKDGILLEVGFDDVTPNLAQDISSWAYDYAADKTEIIDNRAKAVACYDPGYTLVEKLQTISTKFRRQQETGEFPANFMRHYYDVYSLLKRPEVQAFIGTDAYNAHKEKRFRRGDNPNIAENEAFILSNADIRATYAAAFRQTSALYYRTQPTFEEILGEIGRWAARL
ncbi:nucleotidyl transferase AbiEii/AbiGii toxin family protein [Rhodoblastus sp.]|uniref:nucleotidyl transferase AbiEii/AbiGii toxin family protein n=1 Tax=Rhodoblastus sp. TaxID=1962975 RepID=UPI003F992AE3